MKKRTDTCSPLYSFFPESIEGFDSLAELSLDLRWSWNHCADEVWQELDPKLWKLTHNPWVVLQTVSKDQLKKALSNPEFTRKVKALLTSKEKEMSAPAWFQRTYPNSSLTTVAYFSMEFMLSEALPIYSGGLGNVAGDQLKAGSDLGVPVIAIGLLYQQGYFRQVINKEGRQEALFPYNDPGQLPITPLRKANGEWMRIEIPLPHYSIWLRCWHVQVGRQKLYLLDSNDPANFPPHRGITSELYGGGLELRLKQELILGIGGWRLLQELDIHPQVCHLNEGHAAFAILERCREYMKKTGVSFETALTITRAGNLFTTHTAVPAGFDRFPASMIEQYLSNYAQKELGITTNRLLKLGRENPDNTSEGFNMAYLAIRGSGAINGVSRLHGKVSRRIFESLFPRWTEDEIPVGHITNGVHVPSWDSKAADSIWTNACGKGRWTDDPMSLEKEIRAVPDSALWKFRNESRKFLIEYTRARLTQQLAVSGASLEAIEAAKTLFNPNTLLLSFARRFATYKRPNLLLHDPQRFIRLLTNKARPVQLLLAGKAHPADQMGQELIQQWSNFIRDFEAHQHVIFLSDYDMLLTEHLVQGADVWINTPQRPWEASGTSGMKVLVNGGINLSELDGWWAEAYTPEVGWALGDGQEHGNDPSWDAAEANTLYDILENNVIPEFYTRSSEGIPEAWVAKMRESMAKLTPYFSANRTVREYTEKHYVPAANEYCKRTANKGKLGQEIATWQQFLDQKWANVKFTETKVTTQNGKHKFLTTVFLDGLDPTTLKVEIYAEHSNGDAPFIRQMNLVDQKQNPPHTYTYQLELPDNRQASDFTARIIPFKEGVNVPLESNHILWQH